MAIFNTTPLGGGSGGIDEYTIGNAFAGCIKINLSTIYSYAMAGYSVKDDCRKGDKCHPFGEVYQEIIMDGTEEIGEGAFAFCTNLHKIEANDCIEVGDYAFLGCTYLREVVLPNVYVLGSNVFGGSTYTYTTGNYSYSSYAAVQFRLLSFNNLTAWGSTHIHSYLTPVTGGAAIYLPNCESIDINGVTDAFSEVGQTRPLWFCLDKLEYSQVFTSSIGFGAGFKTNKALGTGNPYAVCTFLDVPFTSNKYNGETIFNYRGSGADCYTLALRSVTTLASLNSNYYSTLVFPDVTNVPSSIKGAYPSELYLPKVTNIPQSCFQGASLSNKCFYLPKVQSLGKKAFYGVGDSSHTIGSVYLSDITYIGAECFAMSSLSYAYFGRASSAWVQGGEGLMLDLTNVSQVPTLANSNAFSKIFSHGSFQEFNSYQGEYVTYWYDMGRIYVPYSLYSDFLVAENWSYWARHISSRTRFTGWPKTYDDLM